MIPLRKTAFRDIRHSSGAERVSVVLRGLPFLYALTRSSTTHDADIVHHGPMPPALHSGPRVTDAELGIERTSSPASREPKPMTLCSARQGCPLTAQQSGRSRIPVRDAARVDEGGQADDVGPFKSD